MGVHGTIRKYKGGVAIITGSASGIGKSLARELSNRGCEVILADVQISLADAVAKKINSSGGRARAVELDVRNFSKMEELVKDTVNLTGRLDYIFNNAGIGIDGPVELYQIENWNKIIDINLRGIVNGIQSTYPVMIKQGFGQIVNTASIAGLVPLPKMVSYCMTKHAVVGLSKSLRLEAAQKGVGVSLLCPGYVQTRFLDGGGKFGEKLVNRSLEQQHQFLEKLEKFRPMAPDLFAGRALDLIARNKAIIIVPYWYRLILLSYRFFPEITTFFIQKTFENMATKLK